MYLKMAQSTTNPTDPDKENYHPNIMRQSNKVYPKVSSFCPDQSHSPAPNTDWRTRILQPSDRERALDRKLVRMLTPEQSPKKVDKILTEIPASHSRINMGSTLWRYLYERSIHNMSFSEKPNSDIMDELVRITQEICGPWNMELLSLNSEETLAVVVDALRQYSENRKAERSDN